MVVVVVVVSSLVTVRVLARVAGDLTDLCDVEIVTECHSPLPAPQFLNWAGLGWPADCRPLTGWQGWEDVVRWWRETNSLLPLRLSSHHLVMKLTLHCASQYKHLPDRGRQGDQEGKQDSNHHKFIVSELKFYIRGSSRAQSWVLLKCYFVFNGNHKWFSFWRWKFSIRCSGFKFYDDIKQPHGAQ